MKTQPTSIIRQLRATTPMRPLTEREAKSLAERQAIITLELLGQREPAVDVGAIADLPRIEVKVEPNLHLGGISGFSQWSRGRWLIVVNSSDSATRRRFTLSHEFKHVLDHPFANVIYSKLADAEAERERMTERICDYFAGCLLVPRNWLKRAWANGIQERTALAALFNVSEAAIQVRLQQTGTIESGMHLRELSQPVRNYFRKSPAGLSSEVIGRSLMKESLLPMYLRASEPDAQDELLTVAEACAELRVSKWTLYQFIRSRQLASVKLRSRRLIPQSAIRDLIERLKIEVLA